MRTIHQAKASSNHQDESEASRHLSQEKAKAQEREADQVDHPTPRQVDCGERRNSEGGGQTG
eukprot:760400-Hanusia_phi.AAC.8